MGAVTGRAIHFSFKDRMMKRPVKLHFFIGVALETGDHIFFRIKDVSFASACIHVQARRAMAHFTALDFDPFAGNTDTCMCGSFEFFHFFVMAGAAAFGASIFGALKGLHFKRRNAGIFRSPGKGRDCRQKG